jgi:hypothetical protein
MPTICTAALPYAFLLVFASNAHFCVNWKAVRCQDTLSVVTLTNRMRDGDYG